MSDAFGQLIADQGLKVPAVVARFHAAGAGLYRGKAKVDGGNYIARLISRIAGFPPPGQEVDFEIKAVSRGKGQLWSRRFGAAETSSYLIYDRKQGCVVESFGSLKVQMGVRMQGDVLAVDLLGMSIFGIALPSYLVPRSASREFETSEGAFGFDISASLPVIGMLIRYQGAFDVPDPKNLRL